MNTVEITWCFKLCTFENEIHIFKNESKFYVRFYIVRCVSITYSYIYLKIILFFNKIQIDSFDFRSVKIDFVFESSKMEIMVELIS